MIPTLKIESIYFSINTFFPYSEFISSNFCIFKYFIMNYISFAFSIIILTTVKFFDDEFTPSGNWIYNNYLTFIVSPPFIKLVAIMKPVQSVIPAFV